MKHKKGPTKPKHASGLVSLSPAAEAVYKYSLSLGEADQKDPHTVVNALREYDSARVSGERQSSIACQKAKTNRLPLGRRSRECTIKSHSVNMNI